MLPVPAQRAGSRTIVVNIGAGNVPEVAGGLGLSARVWSCDQKPDPGERRGRASCGACRGRDGLGYERLRPEAKRLLAIPGVTAVVAGCRNRLGGMNAGLAGAALAACGRRLVVGDDGGAGDDLAGCMAEVLASLCGRRPARDRAGTALGLPGKAEVGVLRRP
jgi:putative resolvase